MHTKKLRWLWIYEICYPTNKYTIILKIIFQNNALSNNGGTDDREP